MDEAKVKTDIKRQIVYLIFKIIKTYNEAKWDKLIKQCFENIKSHKSVPQSLDIAQRILKAKTSEVKNESSALWQICKNEYNLISILIADLTKYWDDVRQAKKKKIQIENVNPSRIKVGEFLHEYNLRMRL